MVQRCSPGIPFTVLAPIPALRTGIRVEIFDRDDPSNLVDVLPDTRARKWVDPLFDVGGGEFEIHEDDPKLVANPSILQPGNIIRFYLDEIPRFAARIESRKYTPIQAGEDSGRWIRVSGRGALSVLEDGAVYPAGGIAGDPARDVTGLTPGAAFIDFKDEADARGAIVQTMVVDFTDTLDSANQPYNFTLDEIVKAGQDDLLKLVKRFGEQGVEYQVTPTLQLQLFANGIGVDKTIQTNDTAPVIFRPAHNLNELDIDEDLIIKNTLLIETPAGYFERADVASAATHGRREGFLSLGNTTNADYIDRATNAAFAKLSDIRTAITAEVRDLDGHRPYVDAGKGDWVFAPDKDGVLQRFRIRGMTVSEDASGNPIFIPTLNEEDAELEDRLQRWLRTMSPGTLGGTTSDVAAPNTASTAETEAAASDAVANHVAAFLHPDEFSDLLDVDLTGLAAGDLVYFDGTDWIPVVGNPNANQVPTSDGAGVVSWEDQITGSGGAFAIEELASDDHPDRGSPAFVREFDTFETEDSTTVEDTSPNISKTKDKGKLSIQHPGGDSAAELHGIVWPWSPAGNFYIEAAFRLLAENGNHSVVGLIAADGTTYGAGTQMFYGVNGSNRTVDIRNFNNWNSQAAGIADTLFTLGNYGLIYLRLAYNSATDVWTGYYSPDGISWIQGQAQTDANPAVTHVGFAHSSWGGGIQHVGSWEYIAGYTGLP